MAGRGIPARNRPVSDFNHSRKSFVLDPKLLRSDLTGVCRGAGAARFCARCRCLRSLEEQRKAVQIEADGLRAERNATAKEYGKIKAAGGDPSALTAVNERIAGRLQAAEQKLEAIQARVSDLQLGLPNIPHASVPDGRDEAANVEVRRSGVARQFRFHAQGSCGAGRGARRQGCRSHRGRHGFRGCRPDFRSAFVVMTGGVAKLHRALAQFMLDFT